MLFDLWDFLYFVNLLFFNTKYMICWWLMTEHWTVCSYCPTSAKNCTLIRFQGLLLSIFDLKVEPTILPSNSIYGYSLSFCSLLSDYRVWAVFRYENMINSWGVKHYVSGRGCGSKVFWIISDRFDRARLIASWWWVISEYLLGWGGSLVVMDDVVVFHDIATDPDDLLLWLWYSY